MCQGNICCCLVREMPRSFVISGGREHTNPLPDVRGGVTPRALFGGVSRIDYVNGAHVCWGVAFRVVDVALVVVRVDQPL